MCPTWLPAAGADAAPSGGRCWRMCTAAPLIASTEGPALGAAILAGVGAGVYASVPEGCAAAVRVGEAQRPDAERSAAYEPYYQLYRGLYPALRDSFHRLAEI